jgi:hypothetical protein
MIRNVELLGDFKLPDYAHGKTFFSTMPRINYNKQPLHKQIVQQSQVTKRTGRNKFVKYNGTQITIPISLSNIHILQRQGNYSDLLTKLPALQRFSTMQSDILYTPDVLGPGVNRGILYLMDVHDSGVNPTIIIASCYFIAEIYNSPEGDEKCKIHICTLAVHPKHQRKGVCIKLIQKLIHHINTNIHHNAYYSLTNAGGIGGCKCYTKGFTSSVFKTYVLNDDGHYDVFKSECGEDVIDLYFIQDKTEQSQQARKKHRIH